MHLSLHSQKKVLLPLKPLLYTEGHQNECNDAKNDTSKCFWYQEIMLGRVLQMLSLKSNILRHQSFIILTCATKMINHVLCVMYHDEWLLKKECFGEEATFSMRIIIWCQSYFEGLMIK